jgi:hypothetical protein
MSNLQLSLKRQWFEMTKAGIKKEDYREITPYWWKRLVQCGECYRNETDSLNKILAPPNEWKMLLAKNFDTTTLTLGYPSSTDTERIIKFKNAGIEISEGNPEWGAEKGKLYFVIKHGERIL